MQTNPNNLLSNLANAIRFLSVDAVEKANSGHPGMPLGMADIATILWYTTLKHNPNNPYWFNRDRFVLSNGHGSMLLYALLHLTGYNLSIDELKNFRQLHSKTPGHPEYGHTPGVETTTGPLGQGLANAVGMALSERILASQFNKPQFPIVDHYTYAFVGDGCLMEGISHEAASLAGNLGLHKLIVFYDDNGISIDGKVDGWFADDTASRFRAYNWHVCGPIDGHDYAAIANAITKAQEQTQKPTLIICKTIIGYGSSLANSEKAHGAPLGAENIAKLRQTQNWPYAPFVIPNEISHAWDQREAGQQSENAWLKLLNHYEEAYPLLHREFLRRINGDLPDTFIAKSQELITNCRVASKNLASRKSSQECLNYLGPILPELLGGSADLTSSNLTMWHESTPITSNNYNGNYIYYGVREFAMAAIMNGIAVHGGFIPYGGTFLIFSDYARNAIRLSALMKIRVIYVLTHDSIGLGEDGPTHQPIEHAAMLRLTPGIEVWRPADEFETAIAWQAAILRHHGPTALLLSRQTLIALPHTPAHDNGANKGAYILWEELHNQELPDVIIIATGSEVQLALDAAKSVKTCALRVVSMPCCERFLAQSAEYQEQVLPQQIKKRIAVEAASKDYWYRFVGLDGKIIGLNDFGLSAPADVIYKEYGITITAIILAIQNML